MLKSMLLSIKVNFFYFYKYAELKIKKMVIFY